MAEKLARGDLSQCCSKVAAMFGRAHAMQGHLKKVTGRGHFDVAISGSDFNANPPLVITETSGVWASATEVNNTDDPISGGAHVTVQQVVPTKNNTAIVRLWVDNVPNDITVRVCLFVQ